MSFRNRSQGRTRAANGFYGRSGFDADAQSYFTATGLADPAFTAPINQFILDLKAASLWNKFDRLWILANANPTAALTCIKSLETATAVNAPTFTAGQGYAGDGTTSYLNSGCNPTVIAGQYSLNSAHLSVYCRSSGGGGVDLGCLVGQSYCSSRNSNQFQYNLNGGAGSFASGDALGHWISSRTGASLLSGIKDGVVLESDNTAASGLANSNLYVLAQNAFGDDPATFSSHQLALVSIGGGLSAGEAADYYATVFALKIAIGF